jgi:hypothetical protein
MPTSPSDFIQNGVVITIGADGSVAKIDKLNPHQLATTETAESLLEWLDQNIPEGQKWTLLNLYAQTGHDPHHAYNCPAWQAMAANGQYVCAGETWWNLMEYPNPTQSTVDELHRLAAS